MRLEMTTIERSTWATKVGLARMLAGGVIMDVVTADQARIAEEAGRGGGDGPRARAVATSASSAASRA